jgi:hypothetical protein
MSTFEYPEEFKQRVRKLFNGSPSIISLVDTNNQWLGRYLDDAQTLFSAETILRELETPQGIERLKRLAERDIELRAVKAEYWRLIDNFRLGKS